MIEFLHNYGVVIGALVHAPFIWVLAALLVGAVGAASYLDRK